MRGDSPANFRQFNVELAPPARAFGRTEGKRKSPNGAIRSQIHAAESLTSAYTPAKLKFVALLSWGLLATNKGKDPGILQSSRPRPFVAIHPSPLREIVMRALRRATVAALAAAFVMPAAMAFAIVLPSTTLTLATPNSTYNTLSMTVGFDQPESRRFEPEPVPAITGSCSATFNALFNPTNYQATIPDITFNLQNPGQISLQNATFHFSWFLGLEDTSTPTMSCCRPTPPATPRRRRSAADCSPPIKCGRSSTAAASSIAGSQRHRRSSQAVRSTRQNGSTSSGTVAISTPTMNGNVATYTATVTIPLSVNQTTQQFQLHGPDQLPPARSSRAARSSSISVPAPCIGTPRRAISAREAIGTWDSLRGRSIRPRFRMAARARCLRPFPAARLPCGWATAPPPAAR